MSCRDIQKHIADMYGLDISEGAITNIIDKLIPELRAWQQRPLDAVYPFVWLDAIYYNIKNEGRYVNKLFFAGLGLNTEGHKVLLDLQLSESEGANIGSAYSPICRTWHTSVDGLKGFPEAIAAIFPHTEVQFAYSLNPQQLALCGQ